MRRFRALKGTRARRGSSNKLERAQSSAFRDRGPVTSTIRSIPSELTHGLAEGLLHPSVANFDNIQLVAMRWLIRRIGILGEGKLAAACACAGRACSGHGC